MEIARRLKSSIPSSVGVPVGRYRSVQHATREWKALLSTEVGRRYVPIDSGPTASDVVVSKTALMRSGDLKHRSNRQVFLSTGLYAMADFLRAAVRAGLVTDDMGAAFELGCGGGRLARHLRSIDDLEIVASDVIPENVRWCRDNLPGIEFHTNELRPPLKFATDEQFDFVFAYSVFTHIPMDLQVPWVEELARVLKPNGLATITILGPDMADEMMNDAERLEFSEVGHYTMGPDHPRVSASSALIGSWDVFMTPGRVRELFGAALEVVEIQPGQQSIVTLRKRPD